MEKSFITILLSVIMLTPVAVFAECPISYPAIGPDTWSYEFQYLVAPGGPPDPTPLPAGVLDGFCFDKMGGVVGASVTGAAAAAGWTVGFVNSTTVVFDAKNVAPGTGVWTGFNIYAPGMIDGPVDWLCDHGAGGAADNDLLHGPNPPDIEKVLSTSEGELGDIVHVTISVSKPGYKVVVVDTLPSEWGYIPGTFKVNGFPKTPTVKKQQVSFLITASGTSTIEFDAKVTKAYWEDRTITNKVVATWFDALDKVIGDRTTTADFTVLAFEELQKGVAHDDWPKYHHDLALSGFSTSDAPETNAKLWIYDTESSVRSSPAIVDGILYIGLLNGSLLQ